MDAMESVGDSREVMLFGKWSFDDVNVADLSLQDDISMKTSSYLLHTAGRYQAKRFRKALCPIVERLVCVMMMHDRNNGKKCKTVRIVKYIFKNIRLMVDKNPIQVFVENVQKGGPREDSTRVVSADDVRRQFVDVSALRQMNQIIYLIESVRCHSFRNTMVVCLAGKIMNYAKESSNSYVIKTQDEIERVAKANR